MRVFLIGNYTLDGQESMQRFASVLRDRLPALGVEVRLLRPPAILGRLALGSSGLKKWLGYADKFVVFPPLLRRSIRRHHGDGPDRLVVHVCDHSNAIYLPHLHRVPHLVTCHDLLAIRVARGEFPGQTTRWSGQMLQHRILAGLQQAQRITCISAATLRDVRRLVRPRRYQADLTEMGLNYPYAPMPPEKADRIVREMAERRGRRLNPLEGYLLHVGGNQWYKNRRGVLEIYAALRRHDALTPPLIMAGKPFPAELRQWIADQDLASRVLSVCGPTNEELRALYSRASLLLFPSLHEGFGWPIAEAQACGCRVATTDRSPMTQVGGAAAVYFDPAAPAGAAERVRQLLNEDTGARRQRIQWGFENVTRFSTGKMVQRYAGIYHDLEAREEEVPSLTYAQAA